MVPVGRAEGEQLLDGDTCKHVLDALGAYLRDAFRKDSRTRYQVEDIFYLESCLLSFVCRDSEQLFRVDVGEAFYCDLDWGKVGQLHDLLA